MSGVKDSNVKNKTKGIKSTTNTFMNLAGDMKVRNKKRERETDEIVYCQV